MTEKHSPPSTKDFDARLREARARQAEASGAGAHKAGGTMSPLGMAFRIGIELVSALIVGVGIGWLLDRWLGTGPWLLIVFFFLGAGAGILNVYRAVSRLGFGGAGPEQQGEPAAGEQGPEAGGEGRTEGRDRGGRGSTS